MSQPSLGEFAEPVPLATEMLYACPNVAVTHRLVALNTALPTYMRAPGEASGVFALESAMDEMAIALKMDPIEFRLRNYAETDPHENKPFASKALRAAMNRGEAFRVGAISRTALYARREYADRMGCCHEHLSDEPPAVRREGAHGWRGQCGCSVRHSGYRHRHVHSDDAGGIGCAGHSGAPDSV